MNGLFKHELEKVLKNKLFIGSFIVSLFIFMGILFIGYTFSQNYSSQVDNKNNGYKPTIDDTIQEKYAGELTDERVNLILNDYLDIRQNTDKGGMSFSFYPFYWETGNVFFSEGIYNVGAEIGRSKENGEILELSDFEINKVKDLHFHQFREPITVGNYVPWSDLFKTLRNIFILCT